MANALYTKGKERILKGEINWLADEIKVALIASTYTPELGSDGFLADIASHTVGTHQALASRAVAGGAFDADDATWEKVAAGRTLKGVAIFKDTGAPETSPLLVYIDVISGFPFVANGSDVTVQWDSGPFKIWAL